MPRPDFDAELKELFGVILFDGNCAFCRNVVGQLLRRCANVDLRVCSTRSPRGDAAARAIGGNPAYTFALVTRSEVSLGVEAYVRILSLAPGLSWLSRAVASVPTAVSGGVYDWVAGHRPFMSSILGRGSRTAIPPDRFVTGGA